MISQSSVYSNSLAEMMEARTAINIYCESVINDIDNELKTTELSPLHYFTEDGDEASQSAEAELKATKKSIFEKLEEAISKIFKKISDLLTKGKLHLKAMEQDKKMKRIGNLVRKYCNVQIEVCDFWNYVKKVDNDIQKHIEKVDVKSIKSAFKPNGDNDMAILTENITELTKAIQQNSNSFEIFGDLRSNYEKYSNQLDSETKTLQDDIHKYQTTIKLNELGTYAAKAKMSQAKVAKTQAIIDKIGPKKLNSETVTLQELWRRLMRLEPKSFPSNLAKKAKRMQNDLTDEKIFNYFITDENGHRILMTYSNDLSALMIAYGNFYSALVDYYLNAIIKTIAAFDVRVPRREELAVNRG